MITIKIFILCFLLLGVGLAWYLNKTAPTSRQTLDQQPIAELDTQTLAGDKLVWEGNVKLEFRWLNVFDEAVSKQLVLHRILVDPIGSKHLLGFCLNSGECTSFSVERLLSIKLPGKTEYSDFEQFYKEQLSKLSTHS